MRVMETDTPENSIGDLKYFEEGNRIRLTFKWPTAIQQVYIFKTAGDFDIETALESEARLFTLQEYKKQAGFFDAKTPGVYTYRIYPFLRDEDEDIAIAQTNGKNDITCLTGQVAVGFRFNEKVSWMGGGKTIDIQLLSDQYIDADLLCYVKKAGGYPADLQDGLVYFFGEPLQPGIKLLRRIKTQKNEFIRLFVHDPDKAHLYRLQPME